MPVPYMYIYLYMWASDLVITVPADVQAPNGARPSATTVLTEKSHPYSSKQF